MSSETIIILLSSDLRGVGYRRSCPQPSLVVYGLSPAPAIRSVTTPGRWEAAAQELNLEIVKFRREINVEGH
jgi:hypothetical protein